MYNLPESFIFKNVVSQVTQPNFMYQKVPTIYKMSFAAPAEEPESNTTFQVCVIQVVK